MELARRLVLTITCVAMSVGWRIAQAGHFVDGYHGQDPLCRAIVQRLNKYHPGEHCIWDVISTYPGLTEPPWQELDPKAHMALLVKLEKYLQEGPDGYFKLIPNATPLASEAEYRRRAERFIYGHGKLELWRARLLDYSGLKRMPKGLQAVVQVRNPIIMKLHRQDCPNVPLSNWNSLTAILTSDLSGPDPHVDSPDSALLSSHSVFLYRGEPYLVNSWNVWAVSHGIGHEICRFKYIHGKSEEK